MGARRVALAAVGILVAALFSLRASTARGQSPGQVDPYTAPGTQVGRAYSFGLDDVSSVDPFSGMLRIRHTDVQLAGVGPPITVSRYYNSHVVREVNGGAPVLRPLNAMASGWSFHPPHIRFPFVPAVCQGLPAQPAAVPSLFLSDGTEVQFFTPHSTSSSPHDFIGSNRWAADCSEDANQPGFLLRSLDGTLWTFDRRAIVGLTSTAPVFGYELTRVTDTFGNFVEYHYGNRDGLDVLTEISASDGRQVLFTYTDRTLTEVAAFATAGGPAREVWTYEYEDLPEVFGGYRLLSRVLGPEGLSWSYEYHDAGPGIYDVRSLTAPYGASKTFTYGLRDVPPQLGLGQTVAVTAVDLSGPELPSARWQYAYALDAATSLDVVTITGPEREEVHRYCGERAAANPNEDPLGCGFLIGLLQSKEIFANGTSGRGALLQREEYDWLAASLSDQVVPLRWLPNVFVEATTHLLLERTVSRFDGGSTQVYRTVTSDHDPTTFLPALITEFLGASSTQARQAVTEYYTDLERWIAKPSLQRTLDFSSTLASGEVVVAGGNGERRTYYSGTGALHTLSAGGRTDTYEYNAEGLPSVYTTLGGTFEAPAYQHGVPSVLCSVGRNACLRRSFDAGGRIRTESDWQGLQDTSSGDLTELSYDDLGRVILVRTPRSNDSDVLVERSFASRSERYRRGASETLTTFDGLGRPILTNSDGILVQTRYDSAGRVVFSSDPATSPGAASGLQVTYDGLGRVLSKTYTGDASQTLFSYPNPNVVSVTNPRGAVTTYQHERFGDPDENRPISILQPEGVTTLISYHRSGAVRSVEQNGNATFPGDQPRLTRLDADGRVVETVEPELGTRVYGYDARGRLDFAELVDWDDEEGNRRAAPEISDRIVYRYDDADRLIAHGPEDERLQISTQYDRNNRTSLVEYFGVSREYTYDPNGNLASLSLNIDGRRLSAVWEYDAGDALAALTYPSGRRVQFDPNARGLPTRAGEFVASIRYDEFSNVRAMTYGNGHTLQIEPDADKPRLIGAIRSPGIVSLQYSYDAAGNLRQIDDGLGQDGASFTYDDLNRLRVALGSWGRWEQEYDVKNNVVRRTLGDEVYSFTYGYNRSAGAGFFFLHRLEQVTGTRQIDLDYDQQGNVSAVSQIKSPFDRVSDVLSYDWGNRLLSFERTDDRDIIGQSSQQPFFHDPFAFRYDGAGYRAAVNGDEQYFLYDPRGVLLYEEDRLQRRARDYIYVGRRAVAEVEENCDGASSQLRPYCGAENVRPRLSIVRPHSHLRVDHRASVALEAVAMDGEQGDISSEVRWVRQGNELGRGRDLTLSRLALGSHRIEAFVSDAPGEVASDALRIDVFAGPNVAPAVVSAPPVSSGETGDRFTLDLAPHFADADGDPLVFSLVNAFATPWASVQGSTLAAVPPEPGPQSLQVVASDGLASSEALTIQLELAPAPIVGSEEADNLFGTAFADRITAGAGDDTLDGGDGDDTLQGGAGSDLLLGGNAGNDRLEGGEGNDELRGEAGDDTYVYARGDGLDEILDFAGANEILLLQLRPADVLLRRQGRDLRVLDRDHVVLLLVRDHFSFNPEFEPPVIAQIRFDDDTLWTQREIERLILVATERDDVIEGMETGSQLLEGGAGNDALSAGNGPDTLAGGPGDDALAGGAGDDVYIYQAGEGLDRIDDVQGFDELRLEQLDAQQLIFRRRRGSMEIGSSEGVPLLLVFGHFAGRGIEQLRFGATTWSRAQIDARVLIGTNGPDLIEGLDQGEDVIDGLEGDDELRGGLGRDVLRGGPGNDTLVAEGILTSGPRVCGSGVDRAAHEFVGGPGNDFIQGGCGDNTYFFGLGDGSDEIIKGDLLSVDAIERMVFEAGITPEMVAFERQSGLGGGFFDLVMRVGSGVDRVRVRNWFTNSALATFDEIVFSDGTVLDPPAVERRTAFLGSEGDDTLRGLNWLNDRIFGLGGSDRLEGAAGNDELHGGAGENEYFGQAGDDLLVGGPDRDLYWFGTEAGHDVVDASAGGEDWVGFFNGIGRDQIRFAREGNDLLVLTDAAGQRSVRVRDHFLGPIPAIEFVQPAGGVLPLRASEIRALVEGSEFDSLLDGTSSGEQLVGSDGRDRILAGAGNDQLFGNLGADVLHGEDGNDFIAGGLGSWAEPDADDVLEGGAGNDTLAGENGADALRGGPGDDQYHYRALGGVDRIEDASGNDILFTIGIARTRLAFHRQGNDLLVRVDADASQEVRVIDQFTGAAPVLERLQPDDGQPTLSAANIAARLVPLP